MYVGDTLDDGAPPLDAEQSEICFIKCRKGVCRYMIFTYIIVGILVNLIKVYVGLYVVVL